MHAQLGRRQSKNKIIHLNVGMRTCELICNDTRFGSDEEADASEIGCRPNGDSEWYDHGELSSENGQD